MVLHTVHVSHKAPCPHKFGSAPSVFFQTTQPLLCGHSKSFELKISELFWKVVASSRSLLFRQMGGDPSPVNLVTKKMEEQLVVSVFVDPELYNYYNRDRKGH